MPVDDVPLRAEIFHLDGTAVVRVSGELDLATGEMLRCAIAEIVTSNLRRVTLDLRELTFVDVAGLRALVDVSEMASVSSAEFRLSAVTDATRRAIRLAGFEELEALVRND
jgi:anti-sigma B factor antagonist